MSKPKRAPPLSVRLGPKERERLEQDAGEMSLASYIRSRLFDSTVEPNRKHMKRGRFPVKDHQALAQLMGLLGQSRIANNVNQLARAANTGTLPVTPEPKPSFNPPPATSQICANYF